MCTGELNAEKEARLLAEAEASKLKEVKTPKVEVTVKVNDTHSSTFVKDVADLGEDRQQDLRRVASDALIAVLKCVHPNDPFGVLRLLLNDPKFVNRGGLRNIVRAAHEAAAAENLLENVIHTYHTTDNKQLKRQLLSLFTEPPPGCRGPTAAETLKLFDCSTRQIWESKLHAAIKGAGALVAKKHFQRARLTEEQCLALTRFSVDTLNVFTPAHSDTSDPKFLKTGILQEAS